MDINNMIIKNIADPNELERLYREDPQASKKSFSHAFEQNPDSQVLAVWYERLHFRKYFVAMPTTKVLLDQPFQFLVLEDPSR